MKIKAIQKASYYGKITYVIIIGVSIIMRDTVFQGEINPLLLYLLSFLTGSVLTLSIVASYLKTKP